MVANLCGAKVKLRPRKNHNELLNQFKYADRVRNPQDYTWSEIIQSLAYDIFKLALMLLIFGMFVNFAGCLNAEMKKSFLYQLETRLTKNLNTSESEIIIDNNKHTNEMLIDNLGYSGMTSSAEIDEIVEFWRKPENDFMYGNFFNSFKKAVTESKGISEVKAVFTAFKQIRQIIFEIEMECFSRNEDICDVIHLDQKGNKTIGNTPDPTVNKTNLIHFLDQKGLNFFHNERCFCRNGEPYTHKTTKLSTREYLEKCSDITEYCEPQKCFPGYYQHQMQLTCQKTKCLCDNGTPVDSESCQDDGKQQCQKCDKFYHKEKFTYGSSFICKKNVCKCPHGVAEVDCLEDGSEMCQSCENDYILDKDFVSENKYKYSCFKMETDYCINHVVGNSTSFETRKVYGRLYYIGSQESSVRNGLTRILSEDDKIRNPDNHEPYGEKVFTAAVLKDFMRFCSNDVRNLNYYNLQTESEVDEKLNENEYVRTTTYWSQIIHCYYYNKHNYYNKEYVWFRRKPEASFEGFDDIKESFLKDNNRFGYYILGVNTSH